MPVKCDLGHDSLARYTAPMPDPAASLVLRVALPLPLPRLFDYLPPSGQQIDADWIGCRVRVPFAHQTRIGLVAEIGAAQVTRDTLRRVLARLDPTPVLSGELWQSLQWLAAYYQAPLGEVLDTALPNALMAGAELIDCTRWRWQLSAAGTAALAGMRPGTPRRLAELLQAGIGDPETLDARLPGWRAAARRLSARAHAQRVPAERTPPPPPSASPPDWLPEQAAAIAAIAEASGRFQAFLLDGVTGSGKTEVYLAAIETQLLAGRQALVLVPEIGLTPQALARYRARLTAPVLAYHSGLSDGDRLRVYTRMLRGETALVIGTRSAVFLPLPRAGLIVVDEEHDSSYKQQEGVRYHARDLALVRARALAVPIVLGSATPALETLAAAQTGRYRHLRLRRRAAAQHPVTVEVLDVRKRPLHAGLSEVTFAAIADCLARGEQALVFRNRRGWAPLLICHDCGWRALCRQCDAALTVHAGGGRLRCHHCGARQAAPPACPACGSLALQAQGAGTERIEEALRERFPNLPVLRVDRESTRRRDGMAKLLASLGERPGILVGTQMLAKGHDLPRLTLVVIVSVDEGLFSADFRAPERLAQLLIQVSGRAGRAAHAGKVLLQTHHPEHPLLNTLLAGGYTAFAERELDERAAAGLPPFAHLALLRAQATDSSAVHAFLQAARTQAERLRAALGVHDMQIHGPVPAPMPRRIGQWRAQILIVSPRRPARQALLDAWLRGLRALPSVRGLRWSIDVDPIDLY